MIEHPNTQQAVNEDEDAAPCFRQAAKSVGESVRNLSRLLDGELSSLVIHRLETGSLEEEWSRLLKASERADVNPDRREILALAGVLTRFGQDVCSLVRAHGDRVLRDHAGDSAE